MRDRDPGFQADDEIGFAMGNHRLRIRTLMIGVALVAVVSASAIEILRLARRSSFYRARASEERSMEAGWINDMKKADASLTSFEARRLDSTSTLNISFGKEWIDEWIAEGRRDLENAAKYAEWHAKRKRIYERAARYPWLSVPPDPPRPDRGDPS